MLPCRRSGCFCLQGNFQRQRKILSPVSVGSSSFEHCRGGTCALKSFEQFELDSRVFCWLRPMMGCRISSRIPMSRMVLVTVTSPLHSVGFFLCWEYRESDSGKGIEVLLSDPRREVCRAEARTRSTLLSPVGDRTVVFIGMCVVFWRKR